MYGFSIHKSSQPHWTAVFFLLYPSKEIISVERNHIEFTVSSAFGWERCWTTQWQHASFWTGVFKWTQKPSINDKRDDPIARDMPLLEFWELRRSKIGLVAEVIDNDETERKGVLAGALLPNSKRGSPASTSSKVEFLQFKRSPRQFHYSQFQRGKKLYYHSMEIWWWKGREKPSYSCRPIKKNKYS